MKGRMMRWPTNKQRVSELCYYEEYKKDFKRAFMIAPGACKTMSCDECIYELCQIKNGAHEALRQVMASRDPELLIQEDLVYGEFNDIGGIIKNTYSLYTDLGEDYLLKIIFNVS
jgi:hypothetical protein